MFYNCIEYCGFFKNIYSFPPVQHVRERFTMWKALTLDSVDSNARNTSLNSHVRKSRVNYFCYIEYNEM